ncbi:MAG: excinuclease ABC subunit UvrB [candidate division Zixibacteria bacterium]|nr:excinuclease ABC subunit UvrB [candidate division Zixibacteria bacterium]
MDLRPGIFDLHSPYQPTGDQPAAIAALVDGLGRGLEHQTLLGVTGSGKTFTMANVIAQWGRPTLVISHNKTLAAQLYGELKSYFPNNAVEFFISYYDYYQPEAYVPQTDTYIEKDTSINDDIDRLRLRATASLLERPDVIIVASVSCIYGLGSPEEYKNMMVFVQTGQTIPRDRLLQSLIDIHYTRNDFDSARGTFRVRGDTVEIMPAYEETAVRVGFFGDEIEKITLVDSLTGEVIRQQDKKAIYPAKHFVTSLPQLTQAVSRIENELEERLAQLRGLDKLLEAQRLESRTRFDIEMMREVGYCSGIENYSRHLSGRKAGERPFTLLDFFPRQDFLTIIDESHQSLPQVRGMYAGDRSRKQILVEYGFRLPSALDNRPLIFEEFWASLDKTLYVSATPAEMELEKSGGVVVEQIIRPTGLIDPQVIVRPLDKQVDDLIAEVRLRVAAHERVLVTTLTKRMAEDLADYLAQLHIRVRYLHSEIDAIERTEILRDLRLGEFDVLVGINLLREGLDLPEVSLVAILDADKEGFLRSERALIQVSGRAARHKSGTVIMYADQITDSMRKAIDETTRRRTIQERYNEEHGIVPQTIVKTHDEIRRATVFADAKSEVYDEADKPKRPTGFEQMALDDQIMFLTKAMKDASKKLDFEEAARLRDEIGELRKKRHAGRG